MSIPLRSRKGVLLIEVLITVTILSIGLVMIVQGLLSVSRSDRLNADYVMAAHLARNVLSEAQFLGEVNETAKLSEGFERFTLKKNAGTSRKIEILKTETPNEKKPLTLQVLWKNGNLQKKLSFSTFIVARNLTPGTEPKLPEEPEL